MRGALAGLAAARARARGVQPSRRLGYAANNGVLIYVLFADRDVEILADRGIAARVPPANRGSRCAAKSRRTIARAASLKARSPASAAWDGCSSGTFPGQGADADQRAQPEARMPPLHTISTYVGWLQSGALRHNRPHEVRHVPCAQHGARSPACVLVSCSLLNGPWAGDRRRTAAAAPVVPAIPPPVPTHKFELAAGPGSRRRRAGHDEHQGRHALRHRTPLQRGLRGDRARESGRGSVAAGRGQADRRALAVHHSERAARRHRHQRAADAAVLLPDREEGRAAARVHLPHRHRPRGLGHAAGHHQGRAPAEGPDLASHRLDPQGAS